MGRLGARAPAGGSSGGGRRVCDPPPPPTSISTLCRLGGGAGRGWNASAEATAELTLSLFSFRHTTAKPLLKVAAALTCTLSPCPVVHIHKTSRPGDSRLPVYPKATPWPPP